MTTEDLIARLRDTTALSDPLLTHEAADALEALGREIERLTQRLKMTTNLLSVIEQQQKALNICIAKHYDLAEDVRIGDAIAAGKQAMEQTQVGKPSIELPTIHEVEYRRVRGEAQKLAVSLWTKHYRDDAPQWTVLSDTLGALSQISNMVAGMVRPQATEPAPSTDICQNCAGQGWEPSVYKGKVPCSFCQPAPSTAEEAEPEWNDENVIAYCIARGISSAKAFTVGATHPQATHPAAAQDVLKERQRQVSAEGWTPEHDDSHGFGQMAYAASSYARHAGFSMETGKWMVAQPREWPWAPSWWKPKDPRRNLVKAGALILAEIERLDRATNPQATEPAPSTAGERNPQAFVFKGEKK